MCECALHAAVCDVEMPQTPDEVRKVDPIEGPVNEPAQALDLFLIRVHYEVVRRIIHQAHELPRIVDDRSPLAPGDRGGQESDHLRILPTAERLRYLDRIVHDELRPREAVVGLVKKCLEFPLLHIRPHCQSPRINP